MKTEWHADWHPERDFATLHSSDGERIGQLYVTEWFPSGSRDKGFAWVAAKLDESTDPPSMIAREVEFPAAEVSTDERKAELLRNASEALDREPADLLVTEPRRPPLTPDEWFRLLDLQIGAWDHAKARLQSACDSREEWALDLVYIALSETLAWTYTVDESLQRWWIELAHDSRETLSLAMDRRIHQLVASDHSDLTESSLGTNRLYEGFRERCETGEPYERWCDVSKTGWFNREMSRALSWVRGQLTHTAVAEPVHLVQFREGAEPRWKWAHSSGFLRSPEDKRGARVYDQELAGGDVTGLLAHFLMEFWEARSDFYEAMRDESGQPWSADPVQSSTAEERE